MGLRQEMIEETKKNLNALNDMTDEECEEISNLSSIDEYSTFSVNDLTNVAPFLRKMKPLIKKSEEIVKQNFKSFECGISSLENTHVIVNYKVTSEDDLTKLNESDIDIEHVFHEAVASFEGWETSAKVILYDISYEDIPGSEEE